MPRPLVVPPDGFVTLRSVAEEFDIPYSTLYKRLRSGRIPIHKTAAKTIFIARADVPALSADPGLPRHSDGRHAVMLRPPIEIYESWRRAAGDQPVSVWLRNLAQREVAQGETAVRTPPWHTHDRTGGY